MNTIPVHNDRMVQRAQGGMPHRAAEKVGCDCAQLEELGAGTMQDIVERWHWVARRHHMVLVEHVRQEAAARGSTWWKT